MEKPLRLLEHYSSKWIKILLSDKSRFESKISTSSYAKDISMSTPSNTIFNNGTLIYFI